MRSDRRKTFIWSVSLFNRVDGRHLHLHVRGREERELRGLFPNPQDAGLWWKDEIEGSAGSLDGEFSDEKSRRDHHRLTGPQSNAVPTQRQQHRGEDEAQLEENSGR